MNLLKETKEILADNKKKVSDVLFINLKQSSCTWEQFKAVSNFNYDNGYGGNEIEGSLKIVGDNWWLERGEYDGSEWWEFKKMPKQKQPQLNIKKENIEDRY